MAVQFPINVQRLVNLADPPFYLPASSFRYSSLAIESDQYVCVKDVAADGSNQVVVVDLHHDNAVTRRPTKKAEAALMHTKDNIIVLRGKNEGGSGHFIQIFNLDTKTRLLEHHFPDDIVFWKWVSNVLLAVVTTSSVWHCSLENGKSPEKVFDRSSKLADSNVQIISYSVDANAKWCLLAGISTQDKKTIDGHLQLYSVEKQQQQFLDGHAGCFGTLVVDETKPPIGVFSFTERKEGVFKIHIMDLYSPRGEGHPAPLKVTAEFSFPPEAPLDFPIFEHLSLQHGVIYLVSRGGYVTVLDALSGTLIFRHNVSRDAVFVACGDSRKGGVVFANRKGEVFSATLNEQTIIPYIQQNLRHLANVNEIAMSLVRRYGYSGADELLVQSYNAAFARGDYKTAARIAAKMKSGALRTPQTINQFKAAPPQPGQTSPVLVYFMTLLEHGSLNANESLELVRPVVAQGRKEFITKWLDEDKLECTEQLGDAVKLMDVQLALRIYEKGNIGAKVLQCFVEQGQYENIVTYAKKTNLQTDYSMYLRNMVNVNPEGAVNFAKELLGHTPALIDINQVVEVFIQQNRLQEITSILLEYLKGNRPEHGHLQTRLLELNLTHATQVAEAIFQMELFTHYDRSRIAHLCEKAGLYQRALEHYSEYSDIKRILSMQTGNSQINVDWMAAYFGRLPPDTCLECLTDMLRANRQNIQVVVQVAIKHHEAIGTKSLIDMFETFQSWEGIFYFLGSILAFSTDPDVHFKYIEAASKLNHIQEVERVCRESQYYDAVRVKDYLKQTKLPDPRPLIYVCDRHGYVAELAEYLYRNSLMKYIEVYVVKVNPLQAPVVIGVLIDLDCSEDFIRSLLQNVRGACPIKELVEEVEKRNRLRLLLPWLEARVSEGNQEPYLHNALAMIYIDTNRDPESFLKTNAFYDPKVVGKYCEERDPHLAFTAYKKNWGRCDIELVDLTNKNGLFRLQARYLVERQSPELWAHVLDPDNEWRQQVVDQVVASALPESTNAEEVSSTVRAFIAANLPNELMELLEKIVLHNSDFSQNRNLQNLLILTAIKSNPSRVTDYINRLEHYDGPEIAQVALGDDYKMYEEAVLIYQKSEMDEAAMEVIIDKIGSLERAAEFAARCDKPAVWAKLGTAQLEKGSVAEAIESFLKAENPSAYREVIEKAEEQLNYDELIKYLMMARKAMSVKDASVDSELVFALAKCNRLSEMEEFVLGSNTANVQVVGDRLAEAQHYAAAKALYSSIPNYSKLATCHLKLGEYSQAVDVAKRASSPKTWKEVNIACVHAGEFKCAHIAGLAIISHPDHLEELILNYERLGHFEELITLLEAGGNSERAPVALYSELGVVYAKYKPEKLSEFIRSSNVTSGRLNIPKLIRACERHLLWKEAVFLHIMYKEYDQAIGVMIAHPTAWNHQEFLTTIQKAANSELFYRALSFYLDVSPMEINSLLVSISSKVDHGRVVLQFRKAGHLPLIQPYLEHVQTLQLDVAAVNSALNDIYFEAENVEALKKSITENPNFDQLALAQQLEGHDLLEMRRLACLLYRTNRKFAEAINLSKKDGHYHDAMEAARSSGSSEIAEELLKYFVFEKNDKECFAACLFMCYELLRPDVVLELAWRTGFTDQIMPYMIQTFREISNRLDTLEKKAGMNETEKEKSAPNDYVPDYMGPLGPMLPGMGNLALLPPPGMMTGTGATASFPSIPGFSNQVNNTSSTENHKFPLSANAPNLFM